jgi:short chain dehydrogenase
MTQQQREAVAGMLRASSFDPAGDLREQRPLSDKMVTAAPVSAGGAPLAGGRYMRLFPELPALAIEPQTLRAIGRAGGTARDGCGGTPRALACLCPQYALRAATDPGTACAWIRSGGRPDTVVMTNNIDIAPIGLLTGRVVFITGASRGIGAAAARLFAQEGAAVVLAARSADALDRVVTEVRVEELHGRLDGAFNNGAAFQQQPGPLDTTSDEDIDEQFAVNFRAHWTAIRTEAAQPDQSINRPRQRQRRAGAGPSIRGLTAWPVWAAHLRKCPGHARSAGRPAGGHLHRVLPRVQRSGADRRRRGHEVRTALHGPGLLRVARRPGRGRRRHRRLRRRHRRTAAQLHRAGLHRL